MRDFVLHSISKWEEGNRMRDVSRLYPDEGGSLDRCLLLYLSVIISSFAFPTVSRG